MAWTVAPQESLSSCFLRKQEFFLGREEGEALGWARLREAGFPFQSVGHAAGSLSSSHSLCKVRGEEGSDVEACGAQRPFFGDSRGRLVNGGS